MRLIDTHCHLDLDHYKDDLDEVIERALSSGIERMIIPGIDIESSKRSVEIADKHPQVFAAVGMHPHSADTFTDDTVRVLREIASSSDKVVAVGEVGLDHFRKFADPSNQKRLFEACIGLAGELDLPLIMHNREADVDFMDVLQKKCKGDSRGVVHCFSGDADLLRKVLEKGFHVSFAGNITFKKSSAVRELIAEVPLDRLLLETDSPYITPEPLRGKRNEPANVRYLLDVYAEIYGHTPEDIARVTTYNANALFGLGLEHTGMVVYEIRDSLYLNITNRCSNRCTFCTRDFSDYVKGHNLKLDREPSVDEIIREMGDISRYKEIVFCGFGEPTIRLEDVKEIAGYIKTKGGRVRMITNGAGNIINDRSIAPELKGLIDEVSVSLNAPDKGTYASICRPESGARAYDSMRCFIKECRREGITVEITCLDIIGDEGVEACRRIAEGFDASFRLRHLHKVG